MGELGFYFLFFFLERLEGGLILWFAGEFELFFFDAAVVDAFLLFEFAALLEGLDFVGFPFFEAEDFGEDFFAFAGGLFGELV